MIDGFKHKPDDRTVDQNRLNSLFVSPDWQFKHQGRFNLQEKLSMTILHISTGCRVVVRENKISAVTGNLSRLYTGRADNLHVLQNQQELDTAMDKYWALLDSISADPRTGRFMMLEIGGVTNEPFPVFERLLRHFKHPWVVGEVCMYDGQSMAWGRKVYDVLMIRVYDKLREARKHHSGCTDVSDDSFTRLEVRLTRQRLFRRSFGQAFVHELDFNAIRRAFFRVLLQFDAGQAEPVIPVDGSPYALEALVAALPTEQRRLAGQDILDVHYAAMDDRTRRRHQKQMRNYRVTTVTRSLRQVLNPDSPTSLLARIPYANDAQAHANSLM